jgi:hypothetical protein
VTHILDSEYKMSTGQMRSEKVSNNDHWVILQTDSCRFCFYKSSTQPKLGPYIFEVLGSKRQWQLRRMSMSLAVLS